MATNLTELAIEALEARRAAIDAEINGLRFTKNVRALGAKNAKRRVRTPESRKAQGDAMKRYWAKRKKAQKGA